MASAEPETFSIFGTPHEQPREYVKDIASLEPGDHITFGKYLPNTFLGTHAIVEKVDYEGRKVHIIYFKQSMIYGSVVQHTLTFGECVVAKLVYKPGTCLPAEDVVEYARSKIGCNYNILTGGYFVASCKTGEGRDKPDKPEKETAEEVPDESRGDGASGGPVPDQPRGDGAAGGPVPSKDAVHLPDAGEETADGQEEKVNEPDAPKAHHNLDVPIESSQVSGLVGVAGKATMTAARVTSKAAKKAGSLGVLGAVCEGISAIVDTAKIQQLKNEKVMSQRQSEDALGTRWTVAAGSTAGPLLGAAKGAVIGGAMAGPAAPVGAIVGSIVGGISGLVVGTGLGVGLSQAGVAVRNALEEDLDAVNRDAENCPPHNPGQVEGTQETEDPKNKLEKGEQNNSRDPVLNNPEQVNTKMLETQMTCGAAESEGNTNSEKQDLMDKCKDDGTSNSSDLENMCTNYSETYNTESDIETEQTTEENMDNKEDKEDIITCSTDNELYGEEALSHTVQNSETVEENIDENVKIEDSSQTTGIISGKEEDSGTIPKEEDHKEMTDQLSDNHGKVECPPEMEDSDIDENQGYLADESVEECEKTTQSDHSEDVTVEHKEKQKPDVLKPAEDESQENADFGTAEQITAEDVDAKETIVQSEEGPDQKENKISLEEVIIDIFPDENFQETQNVQNHIISDTFKQCSHEALNSHTEQKGDTVENLKDRKPLSFVN